MDDFSGHLKAVSRMSLFFLSFGLVAWALLPDYQRMIAGLLLGVTASYINSQYLAWKIVRASNAVVSQSGKRVNMGFLTRCCVALLVAVIAMRFSDKFALSTTIAGLFFVQLATLLLGIFSTSRRNR